MQPLDTFDSSILSQENANRFLNEEECSKFLATSESERSERFMRLLNYPVTAFTPVTDLYFRTKWARLIGNCFGSKPVTVIEAASGDADMIPQTLARSNPDSTYITANMNQSLNESLLRKVKGLNLNFRLIEDDAANIGNYLDPSAADLIVFQHGVNDVIQAILCGRKGIDTVSGDWMELLPAMIRLLQQETAQGTLEQNVKPAFLRLISILMEQLKSSGILAVSHYLFQLDLDWGYPPDLFENMVPMIRNWLKELPDCMEVQFRGYDPQWWLFLKKQ